MTNRSALVGRLDHWLDFGTPAFLGPEAGEALVTLMRDVRSALETPPAGEIQALVERAMACAAVAKYEPGEDDNYGYAHDPADESRDSATRRRARLRLAREIVPELCEAITRLSQPSEKAKP